ncbi:MAG: hypothetical protein EPO68_01760 [Planctomycetota bacterium]|nr:MAG: hypothetical protein EPO68_01760 [Planctomycetota bacterium]
MRVLARLRSPRAIQDFLDGLDYSNFEAARSPRGVLRDRRAQCFDGAVLAAAALQRLGYPPLLFDLEAERDDDHVLALYKVGGLWGAVGMSNTTTLRFREPVHRTLRELALSYFEFYFNLAREKTLRRYSSPLKLARFERAHWRTDDAAMPRIESALYALRHYELAPARALRALSRIDKRAFDAGLLGARREGLYRAPRG